MPVLASVMLPKRIDEREPLLICMLKRLYAPVQPIEMRLNGMISGVRSDVAAIRSRPEQCRDWAEQAGFRLIEPGIVDLPPFHYGMAMKRL